MPEAANSNDTRHKGKYLGPRPGVRVKSVSPALQNSRTTLSFFLFAPTALVLLNHPLSLALPDALAWLTALLCTALLARLAYTLRRKSHHASTSNVLLALLFFFAAERVAGILLRSYQLPSLTPALPWIRAIGSIVIALCAVAVFQRIQVALAQASSARKEHENFVAAAECSLDDFYIFDGIRDDAGEIVDFRFRYLNANAEKRLNVKREDLYGKVLTEVRPFMVTSGLIHQYREIVRTGTPFIGEVFIDDNMIKATWINIQAIKLGDGIAITSRDITERKRLDDQVRYLAHHDQLTGLPNRVLMQDRLDQAILRAARNKGRIAVFVLDVDRFKHVNDSLGHSCGDALLASVGQKLLSSVRKTDTVARMGGDEFLIVMPDIKSVEDAMQCGVQIVEKNRTSTLLGDQEVSVTISAGFSLYPDDGIDAASLLKNADTAMYVSKAAGGDSVHAHTQTGA
jgi:diguanylate cyclase (GGDEF)-like protein